MELNCEQLGIDYSWSLARINACHIGIQNEEMGDIRDEMVIIKQDVAIIKSYQSLNLGIWAVIGIALVGLVLKKFWGKDGNNKIKYENP